MKENILKHFLSIKEEIIKSLDKAVKDKVSPSDIDELLDSFNEVNSLIEDVKKSMQS
ncbi:MAG: hypothetical protein U5N85_08955 [Arcicella sp.]|nr:hypothetical protein [Arcicella sp.]